MLFLKKNVENVTIRMSRKIWHTSDLSQCFVKSERLKQNSIIKSFHAIKYIANKTVNAFYLLANRAIALVHVLVLLLRQ